MDDSVQRKYGCFQRKTIAGKASQSHHVAKFASDESLRAQCIRFAPQCTRRIKFPKLHKLLTIRVFPVLPLAGRSRPFPVLPAGLRMSGFPIQIPLNHSFQRLFTPCETASHPVCLRHPGKCWQTRLNGLPHFSKPVTIARGPGYSAAWLARLTGGQEVVGSNPASPTPKRITAPRSQDPGAVFVSSPETAALAAVAAPFAPLHARIQVRSVTDSP